MITFELPKNPFIKSRKMRNILIFIVDHNAPSANLLKYKLLGRSFTNIRIFPSPEECLFMLQKNIIPDFIITDVHFPFMNGLDFLAAIKSFSELTQVLFLSSVHNESIARELLETGATDYVYKTVNHETGINEVVKNLEYLCKETIR